LNLCVIAVKPLVVSAGDDHVIQLPKDSITLYAFVLDDNNGGMFSILIAGFSNERMDE